MGLGVVRRVPTRVVGVTLKSNAKLFTLARPAGGAMERGAESLTLVQVEKGGVGHGAVMRVPTRAMGVAVKRGVKSPRLPRAARGAVGRETVIHVLIRAVGGAVQH